MKAHVVHPHMQVLTADVHQVKPQKQLEKPPTVWETNLEDKAKTQLK